MKTREPNSVETIRLSGRRLTRQRRLVLEVLEGSREHLDAEALYERARALDPKISLATVYRSLALLKETGLVEEHRLGEDHGHFERIPAAPHAHFTCSGCGLVVELDAPKATDALRWACERRGLDLVELNLELRGVCAACQAGGSEIRQT